MPRSAALLLTLVAFSIARDPLSAQSTVATRDVTDTLRLYYVGYPVGYERYQISTNAAGIELRDDFDYSDRGRRTHLVATTQFDTRFSPRSLEIVRVTDSATTLEASVRVQARRATVIARDDTAVVTLPSTAFAIVGNTPFVQQMALVRYWLANGRPSTVAVVPGGPTNNVHVALRGSDTLNVNGKRTVFARYSIEGVVWGTHALWLDEAQRLAAIATAGGGGLSFDAVRLELDPLLPEFQARAAKDRVADLRRWTESIPVLAQGRVAFTGATIIDGTTAEPLRDATLVVDNGRIVAVGPRASIRIAAGTRTINATGKTIIPGLWDMHGHLMQVDWGPAYVGAGVTTARDMGNVLPFILPFRDAVHTGVGIGPQILLAGLIDGGGPRAFGAINATTPAEGRAAVQRYHELGFEQMKLYSLLTPEVVAAISSEAHRLGMTVTGHVPNSLSLTAAVDSGMDQVAHLQVRGVAGSDSVTRTIEYLRVHGTVVDPTASWGELLQHSTDQTVASFQPAVDLLPPVLYQRVSRMGGNVDTATANARQRNTLGIIKQLHDAGVPIVAGTDEGVPGASVHRELELYVAAGIPARDALRYATSVPAASMGLAYEVGTLQPGKRADLVVLDANPLDNISNVRRVNMVMTRGRLYRTADVWRVIGFGTRH